MIKDSSTIGWQGIVLQAPKDWCLVAVSGDETKGYFRVDSPLNSAIEIRWEQVKTAPNTEERTKMFLRDLERVVKKKRTGFTYKVKSRKPTEDEAETGGISTGFTWRGDRNGYGRLMYCPKCQRVVIAQVVSPLDEDLSGLAGEVLASICDHGDEGRQTWALYDLAVSLPAEYKLQRHTLMSSYILLAFKSKKGEVTVERWGLANTLLKRSSIKDWFKVDSLPDYRGFRVNIEEDEGTKEGHSGLKLTGKRSGVRQKARSLVSSVTLRPLPQDLSGCVWHCSESNRLFAVRAVQKGASDLVEDIRDRLACH